MEAFIIYITVFVLAIFVGFEVITKVPPTLHTPLMSGANAISGITVVGAIVAVQKEEIGLKSGNEPDQYCLPYSVGLLYPGT
jgi:NAD(P) transhydrogenase subunit alpha